MHTTNTYDGTPQRCSDEQAYEFRLQGHLQPRWAAWLQGLTLTHENDGTTTLTGLCVDQAALHGLLSRIRDLGVPIVSMQRVCPDSQTGPGREDRPA